MINVRAESLAELLLCEICPKGREELLIQRELFVLVGEGKAPESLYCVCICKCYIVPPHAVSHYGKNTCPQRDCC